MMPNNPTKPSMTKNLTISQSRMRLTVALAMAALVIIAAVMVSGAPDQAAEAKSVRISPTVLSNRSSDYCKICHQRRAHYRGARV